jgi:hypothetical protein
MPQKPLTPLSAADFSSPLDDARSEIARLKSALENNNGTRVLDLQLRCTAYRKFIIANGLMPEFKRLNPSHAY